MEIPQPQLLQMNISCFVTSIITVKCYYCTVQFTYIVLQCQNKYFIIVDKPECQINEFLVSY